MSKNHRDIVLETLRTIRDFGMSGFRPCSLAVQTVQYTDSIRNRYLERRDWVQWLGSALASAGCINPPVIHPDEGYHTVTGREPYHRFVCWYYPYDVLIAGCREWNRQERARRRQQTKMERRRA